MSYPAAEDLIEVSELAGRIEACRQMVSLVAKGPIKDSIPLTNELMRELSQFKKELAVAVEEVDAWKNEVQELELAQDLLSNTARQYEYRNPMMSQEIQREIKKCPHLPCNQTNKRISEEKNPPSRDKKQTSVPGTEGKNERSLPDTARLVYPTQNDFESIPKYMRGRMTYDGINTSIDEFNACLVKKYNFLLKGFNAMASMKDKTRFKNLKSLETKNVKGLYFVTMDDLRECSTLKSEAARKSFFGSMRHLQQLKEIRGPGPICRYVVRNDVQ